MNTYLVDEAVLGDFVETLSPGVSADVKKKMTEKLDHQILKAILAELTPEQGGKLNKLLKENPDDPDVFEGFFKEQGIDLEKIVANAMIEFKNDFEKGGEK
ncbi:hypothetical protein IKG07_02465 [Candidatus Saccharibacteria bacterium]|nr:hypothetical protein [Candidatus Saccharibacteria bacterium]